MKIIFLLVQANITNRAFGYVYSVHRQSIFPLEVFGRMLEKKNARGGVFPALFRGVYTLVYGFPLVPSEEYNSYPINGS